MQMSKNIQHKNLANIEFPLYTITMNYKNIWEEFNILYIETPSGIYILDNKNLDGNTVGKRRLKINNSKKYMPRSTISTVAQLIKSNNSTFIDNTGIVFKYKKTKLVPLKYYAAKEVIKLNDYCIVILKGIDYPIKTNCRDAYGIEYVGLLHTNMGYILYEFSDERRKDTRRKI